MFAWNTWEHELKSRAFENMKDQIGFCGIWFGSCPGGKGVTTELTRRFEEVVTKHNLEKWAPKEFDFKEFMKGLACIQATPLWPGCRRGDGQEYF